MGLLDKIMGRKEKVYERDEKETLEDTIKETCEEESAEEIVKESHEELIDSIEEETNEENENIEDQEEPEFEQQTLTNEPVLEEIEEAVPEQQEEAEEEQTEEEKEKEQTKRIIEAALFMAPGVLNLNELAKISNSNLADVRVLVNQLTHDYWEMGSAIEIRDENNGVRMAIRRELEEAVGSLAVLPEVHKGAMKTLAYIAYKQPVKQSEVIHFRNTKAYDHIKLLDEKGFIRREKEKTSYIIYTTKKFHDYFGEVKTAKDKKKLEEKPEEALDESAEAHTDKGNENQENQE